eukprot:TRINITY_DN28678_c0_g1_i1.p1 TRINITY_DN28678_c0_g1~~TRINITY_DN28678_c0_g1_i1.p1  ORF type:complete len:445 (-),score=93.48 TRINITY_DN28678_c0_g1_i1:72-1406(-)
MPFNMWRSAWGSKAIEPSKSMERQVSEQPVSVSKSLSSSLTTRTFSLGSRLSHVLGRRTVKSSRLSISQEPNAPVSPSRGSMLPAFARRSTFRASRVSKVSEGHGPSEPITAGSTRHRSTLLPSFGHRSTCYIDKASPKQGVKLVDARGVDYERLEAKYSIPSFAVKEIALKVAMLKLDASGSISKASLRQLLQEMISNDIPNDFLTQALEHFNSLDAVGCEQFLSWYVEEPLAKYEHEVTKKELMNKHGLSTAEIDEMKELFDSLDTDNSGDLDFDEFQGIVQSMVDKLGMRPERAQDCFNDIKWSWVAIDGDGDGAVSFHEFVDWYQSAFGKDGLTTKAAQAENSVAHLRRPATLDQSLPHLLGQGADDVKAGQTVKKKRAPTRDRLATLAQPKTVSLPEAKAQAKKSWRAVRIGTKAANGKDKEPLRTAGRSSDSLTVADA